MPESVIDLEEANLELKGLDAIARIQWAHKKFPEGLVLTTRGGDTSAIMPYLTRIALPNVSLPVVFVDTGYYDYYGDRTYELIEIFREWGCDVKIYQPNITRARFEALHGKPDSEEDRYETDREYKQRFDMTMKQEPLNRAFEELNALVWLRGIMAYETPERQNAEILEFKNNLWRVHPILDWTKEHADDYIVQHSLPRNPNNYDITKGRDQRYECVIGGTGGRFTYHI